MIDAGQISLASTTDANPLEAATFMPIVIVRAAIRYPAKQPRDTRQVIHLIGIIGTPGSYHQNQRAGRLESNFWRGMSHQKCNRPRSRHRPILLPYQISGRYPNEPVGISQEIPKAPRPVVWLRSNGSLPPKDTPRIRSTANNGSVAIIVNNVVQSEME